MFKTSILKKLIIISDFSISLSELKKRYSFLKSKNLFKNKIVFSINANKKKINYKYKEGIFKNRNNSILLCIRGKKLIIKNSIFEYKIKIFIDRDFPQLDLINIIDDLIIIKLIQSEFLPIHSSGFSIKKKSKLFASFGGIGKTRIILEAIKFYDKCKIFDEWCLIKNNTLLPFKQEVLLMDYDILSNKNFFNKLDFYRAKISSLTPFKKINEILRILRVSLPYKYMIFKNINSFNIKQILFITQKKKAKTKFIAVKKSFFARQILENFKHEKKQLFKLVLLNNSIDRFNKKISLIKIYNNLLIRLLKKCKFRNFIIDKNKKNFKTLFLKILQND